MEDQNNQNVEQNQNVTQPVVKENKKDSKLGSILVIAFFAIIVAGFPYLITHYSMFEENVKGLINGITGKIFSINAPSNETVVLQNISQYVGGYKEEIDGEVRYLYLREDSTFAFDDSDSDCDNPLVGTFTIGGNTVNLKGKTKYGCNNCFSKTNVRNLEGTISDDTITIVAEEYQNGLIVSKKYILSKDTNMSESQYALNRFIVEPLNGKTPESNDTWLDCSR